MNEVCVPFVPLNSTLCLWAHGLHKCDDPHYPHQIVAYDNVKDNRTCSPCACGAPDGADCSAFLSIFTDSGCSKLLVTETLALDQPICTDLPSGSALLGKGAFFQVDKPGTCAMSGGMLTGGVDLNGPLTLCCQPEPSVPG